MPIDANVFDKIKTFTDYNKADQAFQLQKQTGMLENQAKQLSLMGQIVGNNSIDQPSYDKAKQVAASQGLDISALPDQFNPDVVNRLRFAGATPTAQLSALIASQGHQLKAGTAVGDVGAYGYGTGGGIGTTAPANAAPITATASNPAPIVSTAPKGNPDMSQPAQDAAMLDVYGNSTAPAPAASTPARPVVLTRQAYSPPPQRSGETVEAYKQRLETDPNFKASQSEATQTGKDKADANKAAIGASANYDQVVQTIGGIKDLNNSPAGLPQDRYGIPASWWASGSQNFGDQKVADNNNAFTKLNEAQTIGAIKELASTGQIRMTRTLENILNRGYLIEPGASPTSKNQQADLILAELNNSKIAAQNVDAGLNGAPQIPLQKMPTAQPGNAGGWSIQKVQ